MQVSPLPKVANTVGKAGSHSKNKTSTAQLERLSSVIVMFDTTVDTIAVVLKDTWSSLVLSSASARDNAETGAAMKAGFPID